MIRPVQIVNWPTGQVTGQVTTHRLEQSSDGLQAGLQPGRKGQQVTQVRAQHGHQVAQRRAAWARTGRAVVLVMKHHSVKVILWVT